MLISGVLDPYFMVPQWDYQQGHTNMSELFLELC